MSVLPGVCFFNTCVSVSMESREARRCQILWDGSCTLVNYHVAVGNQPQVLCKIRRCS